MRRIGRCVAGAALMLALALPGMAEELTDHMALLERLSADAIDELLNEIPIAPGAAVQLVPESRHPANWLVARLFERALVARGYTVISPAFGHESGTSTPEVSTATTAGGAEQSQGAQPAAAPTGAPPAGGVETDKSEGATTQGEPGSTEPEAGQEGTAEEGAGESHAATPPAAAQPAAAAAAGQAGQRMTQPPAPAPATAEFEFQLPERGEVLAFRVVECGVRYPWAKRTLLVGPRRYGRMASVKLWAAHVSQPGQRVRGTADSERMQFDTFPGWARPIVEGQAYPFPLEQPASASLERWIEPVVVAGIASGLIYLFYQNQK